MSDKTKEELLKEKLFTYFDQKLTTLTTKMTTDLETVEAYKNNFFDSVIKVYREIIEEQKAFEEHEKQEKEKEKEKEKKIEDSKHEKVPKKKSNINRERPKTPIATNKTIKTNKDKEKHDKKKITISTIGGTKPTAGNKRVVTEVNNKRPITGRADAKSRGQLLKKTGHNKKTDPKKGVKGKKDKDGNKTHKEEHKEEPKEEEKKPVIINPKYIINIPEKIKEKNDLSTIYFVLKKKYLEKKKIFNIITYNPSLYEIFKTDIKYLIEEKKIETDKKVKEIEKFFKNYGNLNTYLNKEFSMSKKAKNSILMVKKKEEGEVLKNQELPKEVTNIIKYLYYLLDEKFDDNLTGKHLFENMIKNIIEKNEEQTFKGVLVNYCNKNKFLNLTKEKADNINKIVEENNNILNMMTINKLSKPISFFCFFLKEVYDYINLKTSDGKYYYELREKNEELQKYLDFIYLFENNGKPRNPPKIEKKEEENQNNEEKSKEEEKADLNEEDKKEEVEQKSEEINNGKEVKEEKVENAPLKVEEESVNKE